MQNSLSIDVAGLLSAQASGDHALIVLTALALAFLAFQAWRGRR